MINKKQIAYRIVRKTFTETDGKINQETAHYIVERYAPFIFNWFWSWTPETKRVYCGMSESETNEVLKFDSIPDAEHYINTVTEGIRTPGRWHDEVVKNISV